MEAQRQWGRDGGAGHRVHSPRSLERLACPPFSFSARASPRHASTQDGWVSEELESTGRWRDGRECRWAEKRVRDGAAGLCSPSFYPFHSLSPAFHRRPAAFSASHSVSRLQRPSLVSESLPATVLCFSLFVLFFCLGCFLPFSLSVCSAACAPACGGSSSVLCFLYLSVHRWISPGEGGRTANKPSVDERK